MESLELLRRGLSLPEAAVALAGNYTTGPEVAEAALESFVQQLGRHLS